MRTQSLIRKSLQTRMLVLDGAMGTLIQSFDLKAEDFGGEAFEGCNEYLNVTRPEVLAKIHRLYLEAGADIIETNSFGGTPLVLAEYGLQDQAYEINFQAAKIAREQADQFSTKEKPRFVAGSMGPTTKSLCVTGGVSFDELVQHYKLQAEALISGGSDFLLLETSQDTLNVKAGLIAVDLLEREKNIFIELAVSGTIETTGTLLAGQGAEAFYTSIAHRDLLYIGLNCATGPSFMTDHLRSLASISRYPIAAVPNAGLPDEDGNYLESPEMMTQVFKSFAEREWINLIGGCCGTSPDHIRHFSEFAKSASIRKNIERNGSLLSGIDFLEVTDELRPVLVGERTNVIGSRKFKRLIAEEKIEEASEIGRAQVKSGAQIVDVCLADPDREELQDMTRFLEELIKKVTAPLMIDSTDEKVIEAALKWSQGKALINSINLEDGEDRFEAVCPLAKRYGAALVVGCIDEDPVQGMAVTRQRKLEVAQRAHRLLTKKYKIPEEDIYWDALVFPCATGDQQYIGSALETIEGVRLLKKEFPRCKTVLGISNVSFGLPVRGREVLNSAFLYHCVQAGLDLALVNTEKLERYAQIPEEERKLCEDLMWNKGEDPIAKFAAFYRDLAPKTKTQARSEVLEERLANYILEGTKEGLLPDLDEALKKYKALEIINGALMTGMDEVGRLFGENKLIVAEVLQSAEVMKAAVNYLEGFMDKESTSVRGTMVLATVKGDVHDIGKNLVDIILSNNGFKVINLGIKVPPQDLIKAIKEHRPDFLGLSGLLVKSAQQMTVTAQDLAQEGIQIPILVGGAALTQAFTDRKISLAYKDGFVEYAKDAMNGLELSKQIVDAEKFAKLKEKAQLRRSKLPEKKSPETSKAGSQTEAAVLIPEQSSPPAAPDWLRHRLEIPANEVWPYVNPLMLLGRHLGVKGPHIKAFANSADRQRLRTEPEFRKSFEIIEQLEALKSEVASWMKLKAVYQFFPARKEADALLVGEDEKLVWKFKRQDSGRRLCLSDFVSERSGHDHIGMFITTASGPVRELSEEWKQKGDYLRSHMLLALALETAEAGAEYVHAFMRKLWGFPDQPEMSMMDRFQARYRGKRYSFGYPACPELEYQEQLFELLKPKDIGVELTDGYMMSPEWTVSALVFSHPEALYFGVKSED